MLAYSPDSACLDFELPRGFLQSISYLDKGVSLAGKIVCTWISLNVFIAQYFSLEIYDVPLLRLLTIGRFTSSLFDLNCSLSNPPASYAFDLLLSTSTPRTQTLRVSMRPPGYWTSSSSILKMVGMSWAAFVLLRSIERRRENEDLRRHNFHMSEKILCL